MKTERDPFAVQLGKKLAEAREHKKMTQFQAAAELKVKTVTSVCRWETGAQLPDVRRLP